MPTHFLPTDGREGTSQACKEQTQIVVNLGGSSHGGTRITACHLLLDGNGRRQSFDVIAFGFVHTAQELSGVSRQALHIPTLPLGIEGIKCQRRFARTRQAGYHHQAVARNADVHILQIVDARTFHPDIFVHPYSAIYDVSIFFVEKHTAQPRHRKCWRYDLQK